MKKEVMTKKIRKTHKDVFTKHFSKNIKTQKDSLLFHYEENHLLISLLVSCFILTWLIGSGLFFMNVSLKTSYSPATMSSIVAPDMIQGDLWIFEKSIPASYKHIIDNSVYEYVE